MDPLVELLMKLENLQRVDLSKIDKFGVRENPDEAREDLKLDKIPKHPKLERSINVSSCGFSSPLEIAYFFAHFPNICSVSIAYCDANDSVIESIAKSCPRIHALDISHCIKLTDKSIEAISTLSLKSLVGTYFFFQFDIFSKQINERINSYLQLFSQFILYKLSVHVNIFII